MKIAIIGTGNIGGTLAKGWAKAGHQVLLGVRNLSSFEGIELLDNQHITAYSIADAVKNSEVILIAAVPQATHEIVEAMGNVKDKIIIDAMNAVRTKVEGFDSSAEALRALTGSENVIKAFNSTGFENMENPMYDNMAVDMFMAGNSAKGKEIVRTLAFDLGFTECYDFGGDDKIPLLESFAMVWINLAIIQKQGRGIAFKILKR